MSLKTNRMIGVLSERRWLLSTILGLATVLLANSVSQAQSYFLGYYYPDEKRFHSDHNSTEVVADSYGVPLFLQRYDTAQTTPMNLAQPVAAPARPGTIHLVVPNAQAKVWFEKHATSSTGTSLDYVTPLIAAGASFTYHITVTWNEAGRNLTVERDVTLSAGQTATVDLTAR